MAPLLLPIGLLTFFTYYPAGHVNLRLAAAIAVGFAIGAYGGGRWAQDASEILLRKTFALLLAGIALDPMGAFWGSRPYFVRVFEILATFGGSA